MKKTKNEETEGNEVGTKESIWTFYDVELQIRDKLLGGVPKNPEVVKAWIDSRANELDRAAKDLAIQETLEEIEVSEEKVWCGFKNNGKPYIEERHIKALLKEASTVLGLRFKSGIAKGVFVKPERIELDGEIHTMERAIHVSTAMGKRSALKKNDYVVKPLLKFSLMVSAKIPLAAFERMFEAASEIGLGDSRTMGYGKFDYTITKRKQ